MKKILIAAVVGGIILFIWQFLSWSFLGVHTNMQEYTPNQDLILEQLGENLEDGFYYLPQDAPGTEESNPMEKYAGKPWAQVYYHSAMSDSMGGNMARGLLVNIVAIALLAWLLLKMENPSFQTILLSTLAISIFAYLTTVYTNAIWFETHTVGNLIDAVVSSVLVGSWLGWWLRK